MADYLDLYDYRRKVFALYNERNQAVLANEDRERIWQRFCSGRDALFAHHPQSALSVEQRHTFSHLSYFPYNPHMCFIADIDTDCEPAPQTINMHASATMTMVTVGHVHFTVEQQPVVLALYWLDVYGGGLFLPFRDTTSPTDAYGGGRYLIDTIKGSDFLPLPAETGVRRVMLDFNYAYNPSCAYNDAWVCPLAPLENRIAIPISAGERKYR